MADNLALARNEASVFYERADASLLAKTPAIIPQRSWTSDQNWEDFRQYLESTLLGLRNWRTPWWMHWGEIAANCLPRRYYWLITPNNMTRGLPINQDVVDSTPTQAIGVCAAGMMDGLSSPTKVWFKLGPAVPGYEPDTTGARWLKEFQHRIYEVLDGSNYYDAKHQMYEDEIVFGNGPMLIYEHRENVINCSNPCAGEYYLAVAGDNSINTFYREFTMTVRQIISMFGPQVVGGTEVAGQWDMKQLETEQIVAHAIEPNFPAAQYLQKSRTLGVVPGGYPWREAYWLRGKSSPRPLSLRGFHEKPFICPRWNTRGSEPYGRSPGMDALPDVRQLHQMTRRLAEAIDKMVRPPMLADVSLKNEPSSILPGRVTYVANLGKDSGMRPTYTVNPQVDHMEALVKTIEQRVERWFYNDVFMMISQMEGVQPRNELELSERRGEKLLRLGPVIERNLREDAAGFNRIVGIMARRGLIPPKPASMRNIPIAIKFVSKLALIQQAQDISGMERTINMAGRMEPILSGTLDNINKDRYLRVYGDKVEFPPDVWSSDEEVAAIRKARDAAQRAALQAHQAKELAPALAGAAHDLSQTDTGGGVNALQLMTGGAPVTGGA